jgi:hypothetical protein
MHMRSVLRRPHIYSHTRQSQARWDNKIGVAGKVLGGSALHRHIRPRVSVCRVLHCCLDVHCNGVDVIRTAIIRTAAFCPSNGVLRSDG